VTAARAAGVSFLQLTTSWPAARCMPARRR